MLESLSCLIQLLSILSFSPGISTSSPCGGTFSEPEVGYIQSPVHLRRYRDHLFCNYAITLARNKQVKMSIRDVEMIIVGDALPEYVVIFDGPDCMAQRIHVVYYRSASTIFTSKNTATALFVSDNSSDSGRFEIEYHPEATLPIPPFEGNGILYNCGRELSGNYGSLYYKGNGTKNALCIWRIRVENGKCVHIRFSEVTFDSPFAWLRVFDGNDCGAREMKFISEDKDMVPLNLISTSNVMTVVYTSAEGSKDAVVDATYWDVTKTSVEPTTTTHLLHVDSETASENEANNTAIRNTFDLLTNSAAQLLAGANLLLYILG